MNSDNKSEIFIFIAVALILMVSIYCTALVRDIEIKIDKIYSVFVDDSAMTMQCNKIRKNHNNMVLDCVGYDTEKRVAINSDKYINE